MELKAREFSITISEARTIEEQSQSMFGSYLGGNSYVVYIIKTKSVLPMYRSEKE